MKNKVITIILTVVFALGMVSCGKREDDYIVDESKIVNTVETGYGYRVLADTETGVMYLKISDSGVCVMVNPDGTPKIWSE